MSFFKKAFKIFHPIESKLFGLDKKKKSAAPVSTEETPEQMQARLDQLGKDYGNVDTETQQGAEDRAKAAGTYAPTTAFKESLGAEAGAAARQEKGKISAQANALRRKLKQPESPFGTF